MPKAKTKKTQRKGKGTAQAPKTTAPVAEEPKAPAPATSKRAAAVAPVALVEAPAITPVGEALYKLSLGQTIKDTKGDGTRVKIGGAGHKDATLAAATFAILGARAYITHREDIVTGEIKPNEYIITGSGMNALVAGKVESTMPEAPVAESVAEAPESEPESPPLEEIAGEDLPEAPEAPEGEAEPETAPEREAEAAAEAAAEAESEVA